MLFDVKFTESLLIFTTVVRIVEVDFRHDFEKLPFIPRVKITSTILTTVVNEMKCEAIFW